MCFFDHQVILEQTKAKYLASIVGVSASPRRRRERLKNKLRPREKGRKKEEGRRRSKARLGSLI